MIENEHPTEEVVNTTEQPAEPEAIEQQDNAETPADEENEAEAKERDGHEPEQKSEDSQPPRKKSRYQKRISQLTAQKNELEARVAQLEKQAQEYQADDDADFDEFDVSQIIERTAKTTQKVLTENQIKEAREQAQAVEKQQEQARIAQFTESEAEFAAQVPDYEAEIQKVAWITQNETMTNLIMDSEKGPQVAYYLAKHPQEAGMVAQLPPMEAARAIGSIEARLSAPAPKIATTAPKPITKVTGKTAQAQKDPGTMSFAEYEKWRKENGA